MARPGTSRTPSDSSLPLPNLTAPAHPRLGGRSLSLGNVPLKVEDDDHHDRPGTSHPRADVAPSSVPEGLPWDGAGGLNGRNNGPTWKDRFKAGLRSKWRAISTRIDDALSDDANAASVAFAPEGHQSARPAGQGRARRGAAGRDLSTHRTTHRWGFADPADPIDPFASDPTSAAFVKQVEDEEEAEASGQADIRVLEAERRVPGRRRRLGARKAVKATGQYASRRRPGLPPLQNAGSDGSGPSPTNSSSPTTNPLVLVRTASAGRPVFRTKTPNATTSARQQREEKEELAAAGKEVKSIVAATPALEAVVRTVTTSSSARPRSYSGKSKSRTGATDSSSGADSLHRGSTAGEKAVAGSSDADDDDDESAWEDDDKVIEELYEAVIVEQDKPWAQVLASHTSRTGSGAPRSGLSGDRSGESSNPAPGIRDGATSSGNCQRNSSSDLAHHHHHQNGGGGFFCPAAISRLRHSWIAPLMTWFDLSFDDPAREEAYQQDRWVAHKATMFSASLYTLATWAFTTGLTPRPMPTAFKISYFMLGPALLVPLPFIIFFDLPVKRRLRFIWQVWIFCATWCFGFAYLAAMEACGYYTTAVHCQGKVGPRSGGFCTGLGA